MENIGKNWFEKFYFSEVGEPINIEQFLARVTSEGQGSNFLADIECVLKTGFIPI